MYRVCDVRGAGCWVPCRGVGVCGCGGVWGGSRYDEQLQDLRTERQAAEDAMRREMVEQAEQIRSTSDDVADSLRDLMQAEVGHISYN